MKTIWLFLFGFLGALSLQPHLHAQNGSLRVTVDDARDWGAPVKAGYTVRGELYDSKGKLVATATANSNSLITFSSIASGSGYSYRVFADRSTIWGEQFWGEKSGVTIRAILPTNDSFKRIAPYSPSIFVYDPLGTNVYGKSVAVGTKLRVDVVIENPSYAATALSAYGGVYLDRDRTAPWDFSVPRGETTVSVSPGGTATVSFSFTPTQAGDYSGSVAVFANSAGAPTTYALTDGGNWTTFFSASSTTPNLTAVTPSNGARLAVMDVTLTGTNFVSGATVDMGSGITVNSVSFISSTSVKANITISAGASLGTRSIRIVNPGGNASNTISFTVSNPAAVLTSVTPNTGDRLQTLDVTFTGDRFITGVSTVNAGSGITVNSVTVNSSTSLTANMTIAPTASLGSRSLSVTNATPGGGTSGTVAFTVTNPAPTLTGVSPSSGNPGQTLSVTISGTRFISGVTSVDMGSGITVNSVTVNSATSLTTNVTIDANATAGGRRVTVSNPAPGGGTAGLDGGFTVEIASNPVPQLTSISPNTSDRLQTLNVTFTGDNFVAGVTTVEMGSGITVNSVTVNSAKSLTANITIGSSASTGSRSVHVVNSSPGGGPSNAVTFSVRNPAAVLTSVTPNTGDRLQTLDVTFTGDRFITGVSTVNAGSGITVNSVTVNSSTSLTANMTIAPTASLGSRSLSVTNATPGGGTSGTVAFTVTNPAPTLTGVSPSSGNPGQTLSVTISGTRFISGVTSVDMGSGITVNSVTVNSATSLTTNVTIDANATAGGRRVTVSNSAPGGGTAGLDGGFTVEIASNPVPQLTSISPNTSDRLQTLNVTFTGDNFVAGVTTVEMGSGITVNSVTVNSAKSLTANVTIGSSASTGSRSVQVVNSSPGGGPSSAVTFSVMNPAPVLKSILPTALERLATSEIQLSGSKFIAGVTSVTFGEGITINSLVVNDSTRITVNVTVGSTATAGSGTVSVKNALPGGGTSGSVSIIVRNPAPTLTSISPSTGNRLQTLDVTFTGDKFIAGVSTVNAGSGITVNSVTVNSPTSLTANMTIAPTASLGSRSLSVTNATPGGGTSGTAAFTMNNPVPALTGVSPSAGNPGQTLSVSLSGARFISGVTSVDMGSGITVNSVTVNSETTLTANITIGAAAILGDRRVQVLNPAPGGGAADLSGRFAVVEKTNPVPTVTSVSPNAGERWQTLDVVFAGDNFIAGVTTVEMGSGIKVNSVTVNSATSVKANVTIVGSAAGGLRGVGLINSAPGGGTSNPILFTVTNPVPVLTTVSPTTWERLETRDVVFTGSRFIGGTTSVSLGPGVTVNSVVVNDSTKITATITVGASASTGPRSVTVQNPTPGGGSSNPVTINFSNPVAVLAGVSPDSGDRLQTRDVVFSGNKFLTGVTTVNAGEAITVNRVTVSSATSLTANLTIAANAALGLRLLTVANAAPGGGVSGVAPFNVRNPVPVVTGVMPSSGNPGQTLSVQISGDKFIGGVTNVDLGSGITVNTMTVDSATGITANITISTSASVGLRPVTVSNLAPGGGTTSLTGGFVVFIGATPTLTSVVPNTAFVFDSLDVTFTGTDFQEGAKVDMGIGIAVRSVTIISPTSLKAVVRIGGAARAGLRAVRILTSQGIQTNTMTFVVNNPTPALTSLSPALVERLQSTDVIFRGAKFISGVTEVSFGTGITINHVLVNDSTQITADITVGPSALTGAGKVAVLNAAPAGGSSDSMTFSVVNPVPALLSLSHSSADRLQRQTVVFTGDKFIDGVSTLDVGPGIIVNAVRVTSVSTLESDITVGSTAALGARQFSVTNTGPGGGTSATMLFVVNNPSPSLLSISPSSGAPGQTIQILFQGTNYIDGVTSVIAGPGLNVNSVSVENATTLRATVTLSSSAALGATNLSVSNPAPGGGTSSVQWFTIFLSAPMLVGPIDGATNQPASLTLSWNPSGEVTAYHLQVATDYSFNTLLVGDTAVMGGTRQLDLLAGNTYYWRVQAKIGGVWTAYSSPWSFSTANPVQFVGAVSFPQASTSSTNYRLFSMPGTTPFVVRDLFPGKANVDWRMFRDAGNAQEDSSHHEELTPESMISPGEGYWLIKNGDLQIATSITMPRFNSNGNVEIPLHAGWNIIGTPYNYNVSWSEVARVNGLGQQERLWDYNQSWVEAGTLEPLKGYYYGNSSGRTFLSIPYLAQPVSGANHRPVAATWKVQLLLHSGVNDDPANEIGVVGGSREGLDEFEIRKPPLVFDQGFLYFSRPQWDSVMNNFCTDYRPNIGKGQIWEFAVHNPRMKEGTIEFRGIDRIPAPYRVLLINQHNSSPVDLRESAVYTYQTVAEKMRFKLLVGDKDFIDAEWAKQLPGEITLSQNYPNPFNPTTVISYSVPSPTGRDLVPLKRDGQLPLVTNIRLVVYDGLGREVAVLVDEKKEPGSYAVRFDGSGLATGVYYYRLEAGQFMEIRKMIFMK